MSSRPCAEIGDRVRSMTTLSGGFKNSKLISQQPNQVVVRSSSSRLSKYVHQRNLGKLSAVKVGGHHEFRGVRTRKGVKGFLVEIRPPRWKRTIWLGTYSTDVEAAGAFDAGEQLIIEVQIPLKKAAFINSNNRSCESWCFAVNLLSCFHL